MESYPSQAVFILYLDGRTWESSRASQLEAEVKAVLEDKMPILLLHEQAQEFHTFTVSFDHFFRVTPQALLDMGIYRNIATALHAGDFRLQSLHESARGLTGLLTQNCADRHETGRREQPHVESCDEHGRGRGAVLDLHRMKALEDRTLPNGEPEVTISPVLVRAVERADRAAMMQLQGRSSSSLEYRQKATKRSAWLKLGAPSKGKKDEDEEAIEVDVDATNKDWLGEALHKLMQPNALPHQEGGGAADGAMGAGGGFGEAIIEGDKYRRKELESQRCMLWREVELSTVAEVERLRPKWHRKKALEVGRSGQLGPVEEQSAISSVQNLSTIQAKLPQLVMKSAAELRELAEKSVGNRGAFSARGQHDRPRGRLGSMSLEPTNSNNNIITATQRSTMGDMQGLLPRA